MSMFKDPIKPMWEDEYNKQGGKMTLKVKKDGSNYIWEEMILALIGNSESSKIISEEINGILISGKKEMHIIQIWFKTYNNTTILELEQFLRDLLAIPDNFDLEPRQFFKPK